MVKEIRLKFNDDEFLKLEAGKEEAKAQGWAANWEDYLLWKCEVRE
tara:strand:- start:622 stop:759 length:138 start_codon:yes stop_codon:yes gene_type:complete